MVTDYDDQVIRLVSPVGNESVIVSTKPLYPTYISKTPTDDVLVSLLDDGDLYELQPSSRRLVQRMMPTGKVINTYEFQEDGTTRLFILPGTTAMRGNCDICVINRTSGDTGELIVLHRDGRVRATYHEHEGSKLTLSDVACDSMNRIIVSDLNNKSLLLLSVDCAFLRHLMSDTFDYPFTIALNQDKLLVGFYDGTVKVYNYKGVCYNYIE